MAVASRRSLVLALTDLGRGSRMQRHALALAAAAPDAQVDIVGYHGGPLQGPVSAEPRVRCRRLRAAAAHDGAGWNPLAWARAAGHGVTLARTMLGGGRPQLILARNPPPAAARSVTAAIARVTGARLVFDWHDRWHHRGDDRAAAQRGRATRRERGWARQAHAHLASSRAMAAWLQRAYGVEAAVLYDRPPAWMVRADLAATAELWRRLARDLSLGPRRVPIAVCPTGWGPHDDFDLLLDALERAERRLVAGAASRGVPSTAPDLAVLITGRGPLREAVEARLARRAFSRVAVRTTWLEPLEYIALLGMADLGICLHQSASGLDLPGALAEFRGVGLPVYVCDYAPVLNEVVETGRQGVTFRDAADLAAALVTLASGDLSAAPMLVAARAWLAANPADRWEPHWQDVAAPLLLPSQA